MSTLRVDRIEPYLSSSIDIVGYTASTGGATTGSNVFVGNQTVTGSIDITGQFLVNGTPITGSGGGSIDTASFATTGSNVFQGNQNINGTLAVTASGGSELKVNNDGTVDVTSTNGFNIIGNVGIVSGGLNANGGVTASVQTNEIQVSGQQLFIGAGSGVAIAMGGNKMEVSGSIDANGDLTGNNINGNTISGQAVSASNGFSGDGSGISNVNAVTLDGLDSTEFATTGSNTFSATQTVSSASFSSNITPISINNVDSSGGMGQNKILGLSANPSNIGGPYSGWNPQPTLYGIGSSGPYQIAEFQSQGNYTDGTVSFKRPLVVTGSISLTDKIESTGKILLKPDVSDPRYLNIYNTAAQDTHITASGGYLYLGDDTTYVNVNNYGTDYNIYVRADNGLNIYADTQITGSVLVSGSQTITGSVDITGDYKVNGVPISTSTIDTGSFATTGSNTFEGNQTIVGNITFPSGAFNSTLTGSLSFSALNDGTLFLNSDGGEGDVQVGYSGWTKELKVIGKETISGSLAVTGSFEVSGSIILTGSLLMTGSATFINNGPSTFNGDTVISTIDSLPGGTPGQIAFQGGKMWVYISGQWNEVSFVAPAPSSFEFSLAYDVADSGSACGGSPSNFYSDVATLNLGDFLWTGPGLATKVDNGFYAGGGTWYQVTDPIEFGEITATGSCA